MIKIVLPLIQLLLPTLLLAESSAGHFEPEQLPNGLLRSFVDSITDDCEWRIPQEIEGVSPVPTPDEKLLWAGSAIQASIEQGDPSVRFSMPARGHSAAKSFTLTLHFAPDQITVRSSEPVDARSAGGKALLYSQNMSNRRFIPGADNTGFVALVPRKTASDWEGIAICPGAPEFEDNERYFVPSGYVVDSVQESVQGGVQAYENTGPMQGEAHGLILTSDNVARSGRYQEDAKAESPQLNLNYFADAFDSSGAALNPLYSGIKINGVLVGARSARREKTVEAFTRATAFKIINPMEFTHNGSVYTLDFGTCYAIFRGITVNEHYDGPDYN